MESKPTAAQKKLRFAPKAPTSKKPKTAVVKTEPKVDDEDDAFKAQDLLRQFNEGLSRGRPKPERKVFSSQVAFGYGGSTTSIKSYGSRKVSNDGISAGPGLRGEKEYREPWDYYTYYPVTLPLRRPYSGNPELLDEEEFGEASVSLTYDENLTSAAEELNLTEESSEPNLLFLQLPPSLPKRPSTAQSHETAESSKSSSGASGATGKSCSSLNGLPAGLMGKMLIYRSGAIKLKLGDTLYDVSSGSKCVFAQDAVAINTTEKHCCVLGELNKRAVLTPDVDSVLDGINML